MSIPFNKLPWAAEAEAPEAAAVAASERDGGKSTNNWLLKLAAKRTARATPFSIDSPGLLAPPVNKFKSYINIESNIEENKLSENQELVFC